MSATDRRLGPHLAILAHHRKDSGSLSGWARDRQAIIGDRAEPVSPQSRMTGPPNIRFADLADAARWFGRTRDPIAYTWALIDGTGARIAASAWAFPTPIMAERDARTIQEFVEQLTLHFTATSDSESAWHGERAGLPILYSSTPHPNRDEALRAATVAVGLLPVATVAGHPVKADQEP